MYSKNKFICPCCGKPLELIPPTEKLLPNRYSISSNDIPFYLVSDPRYIPYTLYPTTLSEFNSSVLFEDVKIDKYCLLNKGNSSFSIGYNKRYYKIITVYRTEKMLKQNFLLSNAMYAVVIFCKNCRRKIALNIHPTTIFDNSLFLGIFIFTVSFIVPLTMLYPQWLYTTIISVGFSISLLIIFVSLLTCLYVKLFMSNFVVTDLRDNTNL